MMRPRTTVGMARVVTLPCESPRALPAAATTLKRYVVAGSSVLRRVEPEPALSSVFSFDQICVSPPVPYSITTRAGRSTVHLTMTENEPTSAPLMTTVGAAALRPPPAAPTSERAAAATAAPTVHERIFPRVGTRRRAAPTLSKTLTGRVTGGTPLPRAPAPRTGCSSTRVRGS